MNMKSPAGSSKKLHKLTRRPGLHASMILVAALSAIGFAPQRAQAQNCSLDSWAPELIAAWNRASTIPNAPCYAEIITSMDVARTMRDNVWSHFDTMFPRIGYKVVGLDPVNAALPGVDRPMVGALYASMFMPNGSVVSMQAADVIITEPDILISVADEGINEATTLEEAVHHLDRIYAFIETLAPTFNNNPANPFLMQSANIMARWGVIGESIEVSPTAEFIRSLETMKVTFRDGEGNVLAEQPGSYLGENALNGVLVVIEELKRRGERLRAGDLISSGSYMPPVRVTGPIEYETIYENIGGTTLRVSTSFVD